MTAVLALLAVALGGDANPPVGTRLPTVATLERIALVRAPGTVAIEVDPLAAKVELRPARDAAGLAAKIVAGAGRLCRDVRVVGAHVVLRCASRRLDAALSVTGGKLYLELHELRGLPWRGEDNRIAFSYDSILLGMGPCPGSNSVERGECALKQGRVAEAALEFRRSIDGDGRKLAALRLGDIAMASGDTVTASGWYQIAGRTGIFGRLAQGRLCEMGGGCLEEREGLALFEAATVPDPVRTELQLRAARIAAFAGRTAETVRLLGHVVARAPATHACGEIGAAFCRRLVLFALENAGEEDALRALEIYLQVPRRLEGPHSIPMVRAAAERAAATGAPIFGANLLAAAAAMVEAPSAPDHLLRTAELYLVAEDLPRARVIAEYAESKVGRRALGGARWAAVFAAVRKLNDITPVDEPALSAFDALVTEGTTDLAAAYGALARARTGGAAKESSKEKQ